MRQRRRIGFVFLIILGLVIDLALKNVKAGLLIGLIIGLFAGSLGSRMKE